MQKFLYKGLKAGKYTDGIIEALDKDEAIFKLREKNNYFKFKGSEK